MASEDERDEIEARPMCVGSGWRADMRVLGQSDLTLPPSDGTSPAHSREIISSGRVPIKYISYHRFLLKSLDAMPNTYLSIQCRSLCPVDVKYI